MRTLKQNFASSSLYQERSESMKGFLSRRWSFWLALFSCVSFLVGNMVGQHGWNAFWKSVWGQETEIVFTGTASPLARIPDPDRWSPLANHSYRYADVPDSLLVPFSVKRPKLPCGEHADNDRRIFSVQYNGDYESGGEGCGSHPAEDILIPKGTPVYSIMNGTVDRIEERSWGFGNTIVIRHPNVPDPKRPGSTTTLYSSYSHLGSMIVQKGATVLKGQQIAVSGQTGFATAPHLHVQIDTEDAPFHPYWPFTTAEATAAGLSFMQAVDEGLGQKNAERYTVNPLAYVASHLDWSAPTVIVERLKEAQEKKPVTMASSIPVVRTQPTIVANAKAVASVLHPRNVLERMRMRRTVRVADRIARRKQQEAQDERYTMNLHTAGTPESAPTSTAPANIPMPTPLGEVASISIFHDGSFDREWDEIVLFARDENGNFIHRVLFKGSLFIEPTFGHAEFSPSVITAEQFDSRGRAFVRMLPRGHKTIIPVVRGAFSADGEPMIWEQRAAAQKVATVR